MEKKDTRSDLLQLRINGAGPNRLGPMLGLLGLVGYLLYLSIYRIVFWSMLPNLKNVDDCKVIIYIYLEFIKKKKKNHIFIVM